MGPRRREKRKIGVKLLESEQILCSIPLPLMWERATQRERDKTIYKETTPTRAAIKHWPRHKSPWNQKPQKWRWDHLVISLM